jgi:AcrR family transcriptional regulator
MTMRTGQDQVMTDHPKPRPEPVTPVWERPEPTGRTAPAPLSRELIVRAAIAVADDDGLVAVSVRKIAAALGAGPMRLYRYVATKDELLELMVDAVYAEIMSIGSIPSDWREGSRALARRVRTAAGLHPWFVELLGGRPHQGPNALAYLEALFAVLDTAPGVRNIDWLMRAARTISAYIIGALRSEANEWRTELDTGMDKTQWQTANAPYLYRMIATGRFPHLENVIRDATHPPADEIFEQGLDTVLDGIAALLTSPPQPR